jgi:AcrR family transcriptional regulator
MTLVKRQGRKALETRRRIREGARELFLDRGYAATTIEAIAERSDVAVQTVYAVFKNKRAILREIIDVAIVGDDLPIGVSDRQAFQDILHGRDVEEIVARWARFATALFERTAAIFAMADAAGSSDPEIARWTKQGDAGRLANFRKVLAAVLRKSRADAAPDGALDLMYAIVSPSFFRMLVTERGWTPARYEAWVARAITTIIAPGKIPRSR